MSTNQPSDHPARKPAQSGGTKNKEAKTRDSQVNPATPPRGPFTKPGTMPEKPGSLEPVRASSESGQDQKRDDSAKEPASRPGRRPSSNPRKAQRPGEGSWTDSSGKSYEGETGESGEVDSRDDDHDAK